MPEAGAVEFVLNNIPGLSSGREISVGNSDFEARERRKVDSFTNYLRVLNEEVSKANIPGCKKTVDVQNTRKSSLMRPVKEFFIDIVSSVICVGGSSLLKAKLSERTISLGKQGSSLRNLIGMWKDFWNGKLYLEFKRDKLAGQARNLCEDYVSLTDVKNYLSKTYGDITVDLVDMTTKELRGFIKALRRLQREWPTTYNKRNELLRPYERLVNVWSNSEERNQMLIQDEMDRAEFCLELRKYLELRDQVQLSNILNGIQKCLEVPARGVLALSIVTFALSFLISVTGWFVDHGMGLFLLLMAPKDIFDAGRRLVNSWRKAAGNYLYQHKIRSRTASLIKSKDFIQNNLVIFKEAIKARRMESAAESIVDYNSKVLEKFKMSIEAKNLKKLWVKFRTLNLNNKEEVVEKEEQIRIMEELKKILEAEVDVDEINKDKMHDKIVIKKLRNNARCLVFGENIERVLASCEHAVIRENLGIDIEAHIEKISAKEVESYLKATDGDVLYKYVRHQFETSERDKYNQMMTNIRANTKDSKAISYSDLFWYPIMSVMGDADYADPRQKKEYESKTKVMTNAFDRLKTEFLSGFSPNDVLDPRAIPLISKNAGDHDESVRKAHKTIMHIFYKLIAPGAIVGDEEVAKVKCDFAKNFIYDPSQRYTKAQIEAKINEAQKCVLALMDKYYKKFYCWE